MKPFPVIKIEFNGHKPTHKIRIKSPMGTKFRNPLATSQRLRNPITERRYQR